MVSVAQLVRYRLQTERFIHRNATGCLRTEFGDFKVIQYNTSIGAEVHLALVRGELSGAHNVLVRMHAHCVMGDVFGSTQCNCQATLRAALKRIAEEDRGALVYLHQTGPGVKVVPNGEGNRLLTHGAQPNFPSSELPGFQHEIGIGSADPRGSGFDNDSPADQPSSPRRRALLRGVRDRDHREQVPLLSVSAEAGRLTPVRRNRGRQSVIGFRGQSPTASLMWAAVIARSSSRVRPVISSVNAEPAAMDAVQPRTL
jgi:hypothetical protein